MHHHPPGITTDKCATDVIDARKHTVTIPRFAANHAVSAVTYLPRSANRRIFFRADIERRIPAERIIALTVTNPCSN